MRVLIDTNILFSALLFPGSKPAAALLHVADHHEMVLCDRNIAEIRDILQRKAPKYLPDAEVLLAEMSYELILDIILTGDKDFLSLDMDHPKCMTASEYLEMEDAVE